MLINPNNPIFGDSLLAEKLKWTHLPLYWALIQAESLFWAPFWCISRIKGVLSL